MKKPLVIGLLLAAIVALASYVAAGPYLALHGIRTALAINVGTAPLAFLVGGGGLGELIFTGIDLNDFGMMLAGALSTALLAIAVDLGCGLIQTVAVSRGLRMAGRQ